MTPLSMVTARDHDARTSAANAGQGEVFFALVAVVSLALGASAQVLSVFGALKPAAFLFAVLMMSALLWWLLKKGCAAATKGMERMSAVSAVAVGIIVVALATSAIRVAKTPSFAGDERHYHASRCLYWMENGSIFPYTTHNDRQTAFGYQSELFFFTPVLLSRSETAGRLVFWLGYPLAVISISIAGAA